MANNAAAIAGVAGALAGGGNNELTQFITGPSNNNNNNNGSAELDAARQRQEQQERLDNAGPCACFVWLCFPTTTLGQRCQFIVWIILGLLGVVFYGVYLNQQGEGSSLNWGYFLVCATSILLSSYATYNFQDIFRLKAVVDNIIIEAKKLEENRKKVQTEIGNLRDTRDKLAQLEEEQSISNAQLRSQSSQFEKWSKLSTNMTGSNHKDAYEIKDKVLRDIEDQKRSILRSERGILYNALAVFEKKNDEPGLDRIEYEAFLTRIPMRYKVRLRTKSFDEWSNNDELIDTQDFRGIIQELVTKELPDLANSFGIDIPSIQDGIPAPLSEEEEVDEEKTA